MVFDPWAFEHTATKDGEGCVHSGWYTRFYPDACAKAFCLTGDGRLLDRAKEFWYYGSKREYQTKQPRGGRERGEHLRGPLAAEGRHGAGDLARLFYAASHPRKDQEPPAAVADLRVKLLGDGKAEVRFTAPADRGGPRGPLPGEGGRVAHRRVRRLGLRCATRACAATGGGRRTAAANRGRRSPAPKNVSTVTGLPVGKTLYFAVRSYDESENLSPLSNVAIAKGE